VSLGGVKMNNSHRAPSIGQPEMEVCVAFRCYFAQLLLTSYTANTRIVKKNCELFIRSMRGAWLALTSQSGKLGYLLLSTRSF
jgi:hypothetical protein